MPSTFYCLRCKSNFVTRAVEPVTCRNCGSQFWDVPHTLKHKERANNRGSHVRTQDLVYLQNRALTGGWKRKAG